MKDCAFFRDRCFAEGASGSSELEWRQHLMMCPACRQAYAGLRAVDRGLAALASDAVAVPPFETIARPARGAARHQRQRQAVRRSLPFFYTGLATAAAAAAIVLGVWVGAKHSARPSTLLPGGELTALGETRTAVLRSGAAVRLESGSVKLAAEDPHEETLVLATGRVSLQVPKLALGVTLAVRTPDAEVRVHGTRFAVVRQGRSTLVQVTEGLVEVRPAGEGRPSQFLRAGESTTVSSLEDYREGLRRGTQEALEQGNFTAAEAKLEALASEGRDDMQRAEIQALLAWSLAARGERDQAIRRYVQALSLLPKGWRALWAENACAELAFLVEQQTPARAAATWRFCLHRFPNGVHAALAGSRSRAARSR